MKYDLPKPSIASLIIQCSMVLACAVCLYFFLTAMQTKKSYATAITALNQKQQSLTRAAQQLDKYQQFVAADPFYQCNSKEPQWEKMDETWVDLPYDQLLQRLANLYRPDRPFVLDFFSASLKNDQIDGVAKAAPAGDSDGVQQNQKLVFNLQGYFLCPCR